MTRRRLLNMLRVAVVCFAIGAVVNIAVALYLWHYTPLHSARSQSATTTSYDHVVTVDLGRGVERVIFRHRSVARYSGGTRRPDLSKQGFSEVHLLALRSQAARHAKVDPAYMQRARDRRLKHYTEDNWYGFVPVISQFMAKQIHESGDLAIALSQTGWPWPSFHGELTLVKSPAPNAYPVADPATINRIKNIADAFAVDGGAYPRKPLWTGLILNTLLYAAAAYLLIPAFAFRQTRNHFRSKRNVCLRCAYPRTDLPSPDTICPECGT